MLLHRIEKYLRTSRMPPARFGREAVGDSRFVFDLQAGREPREKMVRKVETFIRNREEHPQ